MPASAHSAQQGGHHEGGQPQGGHHEGFPWKHIIGYLLSLVLTAIAFWVSLVLHFSTAQTIGTILGLAVIQMAVQLFLFMHLTEKIHGDAVQKVFIYTGIMFALVVVIGSMWVMTFKSSVS
ncbi:cytochrome aa3 quinol oxidase subunit IV [Alicyclobacillus sp. ALC3]|nr:cytochrome aa3 quinol oxidase subunit IV [Alicyclobacillus sp. ALC3]